MKIIAKRTHQYGRKQIRPGVSYDATKDHAKFLVDHGFSDYPVKVETPAPPPAVKPPVIVAKDLTASSEAETKRVYKRKDLTSEEGKDSK